MQADAPWADEEAERVLVMAGDDLTPEQWADRLGWNRPRVLRLLSATAQARQRARVFDLRATRKALGLTQARVARRLGVTRSALSSWERGKWTLTPSHLSRWRTALDSGPGIPLSPSQLEQAQQTADFVDAINAALQEQWDGQQATLRFSALDIRSCEVARKLARQFEQAGWLVDVPDILTPASAFYFLRSA